MPTTPPEKLAALATAKMWARRYDADPNSLSFVYSDDAEGEFSGPVVVDLGDLVVARRAAADTEDLVRKLRKEIRNLRERLAEKGG